MTRATGRATRLTRLRDELRRRPLTVVQLAEMQGVGRRSIERDLRALADELGESLEVDDQHRYSIPVKSSALNDVEALALYSAARLLLHTGVGEQYYRNAMLKLAQQVPEPARTALIRGVEKLKTSPGDRVLDLVAQAWFQQRVLRCRYRSANSGTTERRDIEVYFVEIGRRNNEAYVLGFDRTKRQEVLVFRLSRMQDVQLLNETYTVPEGLDAQSALEDGVVVGERIEVTVRVSADAAKAFQDGAKHLLNSFEMLPDGDGIARVRGTLDNKGRPLELLPWLLGWGGAVEVVDPESVRADVAGALMEAVGRYRALT